MTTRSNIATKSTCCSYYHNISLHLNSIRKPCSINEVNKAENKRKNRKERMHGVELAKTAGLLSRARSQLSLCVASPGPLLPRQPHPGGNSEEAQAPWERRAPKPAEIWHP